MLSVSAVIPQGLDNMSHLSAEAAHRGVASGEDALDEASLSAWFMELRHAAC